MATAFFSSHQHLCRGNPGLCSFLRRPAISAKPSTLLLSSSNRRRYWAANSSTVERRPTPPKDEEGGGGGAEPERAAAMEGLVDFLYEDLPHLFDDRGIDPTMYDDGVAFRDPITKHDSIAGYLFNIRLLKQLFRPEFQLHSVRQTGPYEITTRWTMVMRFVLLPWNPELIFTGISIMGVNPQTKKFCSHTDLWDSIENNDYFSLEGFLDVLKQLRIYKTPDLETPKYQILKRTATYEVRKYEPFVIAETKGDKLSGSSGFNEVAGYIFGKNSTEEKIPMTTPVFTQVLDDDQSEVSIQIVLPKNIELSNLPAPSTDAVKLRKVEGGIAAAIKFSGKPSEELVRSKEKELRSALLKSGLQPKEGCLLARYNDPGRTMSFLMNRTTERAHVITPRAVERAHEHNSRARRNSLQLERRTLGAAGPSRFVLHLDSFRTGVGLDCHSEPSHELLVSPTANESAYGFPGTVHAIWAMAPHELDRTPSFRDGEVVGGVDVLDGLQGLDHASGERGVLVFAVRRDQDAPFCVGMM